MHLKEFIKQLLAVLVLPFMLVLLVARKIVGIRVMTTHQKLLGHLSLEPEKYLTAVDTKTKLYEIDFLGQKEWANIRVRSVPVNSLRTISIWTFSRPREQANGQLVKMWKRELLWAPSYLVDVLLRANRLVGKKAITEYRFSTLISADRHLDDALCHLSFTDKEIRQAEREFDALGLTRGSQFVCLIVREQINSDHGFRNREINDFTEMVSDLAQRGIGVIRMGANSGAPLQVEHPLVCDYANSGKRTELLDLYLLANCKFAISTLSGPDATCLAFRRPVLYVDIANYSLCFTGTALTTWVPGVIVDTNTNKKLSLREVFDSGAGWFWRDSQFHERGLDVVRSSPEEIRDYTIDMLNWVDSGESTVDKERQNIYRSTMADAMGDLGEKWHGQINSRMSIPFLTKHGDWFLS